MLQDVKMKRLIFRQLNVVKWLFLSYALIFTLVTAYGIIFVPITVPIFTIIASMNLIIVINLRKFISQYKAEYIT